MHPTLIPERRLIANVDGAMNAVALDVPGFTEAKSLVEQLGDEVLFYKIGLELAASRDYFPLLDWLLERDKRVFADLKLYDIPASVAAAVRKCGRATRSLFFCFREDKGKHPRRRQN